MCIGSLVSYVPALERSLPYRIAECLLSSQLWGLGDNILPIWGAIMYMLYVP